MLARGRLGGAEAAAVGGGDQDQEGAELESCVQEFRRGFTRTGLRSFASAAE